MKRLYVTVSAPRPLVYAPHDVRYQRPRPRVIVIIRAKE